MSNVDMVALQIAQTIPQERRAEFQMAYMSQAKNRTTALLLSIFLGGYGVDRFYAGDVGLGVLKLLTCGGFGIWWLIDLFVIMGAIDAYNRNVLVKLQTIYAPQRPTGQQGQAW